MPAAQFRSYVWDPLLIISQIVAVQSIFYVGLGFWQFLMNLLVTSHPISVQQLFDINEADFSTKSGRVQLSIFLLNSICCAVSLWFIVQRAKLCLDFAFTAHFLHFICCWCVLGFPTSWIWWVKVVLGIALTSILGEYLCMRYELKAIPVTTSGVS